MKKLLIGLFGFVFLLSLWVNVSAETGYKFDERLKFLLNDETDPFFPDTIRHDFLAMGMKKCATMCDWVINERVEGYVNASDSLITYSFTNMETPRKVLGIKIDTSDYALMEIKPKDIAQKKIATSEELRYWYEWGHITNHVQIGVYPVATDSVNFHLFLSGIPGWDDTTYINPSFVNEVILYALYLCKQRQGEREIAQFIRQIAINEILDLKAIYENRPKDVTVAKQVISR